MVPPAEHVSSRSRSTQELASLRKRGASPPAAPDRRDELLLLALGDIAQAKGLAQVAQDAGLGRKGLQKALTSE